MWDDSPSCLDGIWPILAAVILVAIRARRLTRSIRFERATASAISLFRSISRGCCSADCAAADALTTIWAARPNQQMRSKRVTGEVRRMVCASMGESS
jgi:hypothetical protein